MKKKGIAVLGFIVLISIIGTLSCRKCGPFPDRYKVIGMSAGLIHVKYDSSASPSLVRTELGSDTISYANLGIGLSARMEEYFSFYQKINSFGIISTAYACSPGRPTSSDRVTKLEIYANKDFDATHTVGSNLAEYFDIFLTYYTGRVDTEFKQDLQSFVKSKPIVPDVMVLLLKKPPKNSSKLVFTVKYSQDGVSFSDYEIDLDSILVLK